MKKVSLLLAAVAFSATVFAQGEAKMEKKDADGNKMEKKAKMKHDGTTKMSKKVKTDDGSEKMTKKSKTM